MKFVAHEDVEAPIEFVFDQVSDFAAIERSVLRRGAEVQRVDDLEETRPGMKWDAAFDLRGKRREMQLELTELDRPNGMVIASRSPNMGGQMVLDLVALSRSRTRVNVEIDMTPRTLAAKLLVQSMKLAKGNLTKRFRQRVAGYAKDLEDRYKDVA
ncbi:MULTISPECIES: SRPBCC family protein [Roseovarius]|uniref:SRPBCC family protein n=1 Tax=Roseovarius TaxID=74030 RepID=UPI001C9597E4|nr:SRPBCC family protein [Roseovarius atlanticus]MBY5986615.1 SRPBCC family protein [Roseovarius atlanticus]MBY6125255.1 SRPBCC family protein [Roseovarius atlanticus]MBY6150284.1 SRPBCC family protein [Roseovarius atlanticus]